MLVIYDNFDSFSSSDSAPTLIKLFSNIQSPGFDDVEGNVADQILNLSVDDYRIDNKINLKIVKFQQVNK